MQSTPPTRDLDGPPLDAPAAPRGDSCSHSSPHRDDDARGRRDSPIASSILAATALILAALVIIQAGRLPSNVAWAGGAASSGEFSVVTATNGLGKESRPQELLYVVDNRSEILYVYEIEDGARRQIVLRDVSSLPALFRAGRGR